MTPDSIARIAEMLREEHAQFRGVSVCAWHLVSADQRGAWMHTVSVAIRELRAHEKRPIND